MASCSRGTDAEMIVQFCMALRHALGRFFQIVQDFLGVALWLHLLENMLDLPVGADDESGPRHAHNLFAIHIFFFHDAESLGDLLVLVSEQGEGQVEFLLEFLLRLWGVGRYAEQHGARLLHLFVSVAEPASFDGSARSVGAGVKVENDGLRP
jgi:hypothetical protein